MGSQFLDAGLYCGALCHRIRAMRPPSRRACLHPYLPLLCCVRGRGWFDCARCDRSHTLCEARSAVGEHRGSACKVPSKPGGLARQLFGAAVHVGTVSRECSAAVYWHAHRSGHVPRGCSGRSYISSLHYLFRTAIHTRLRAMYAPLRAPRGAPHMSGSRCQLCSCRLAGSSSGCDAIIGL